MEEKRIYVVVAAIVNGENGRISQPLGRQVAQACHAVSLVRIKMALDMPLPKVKGKVDTSPALEPITTIVLQARDGEELDHIFYLLTQEDIPFEFFRDTNDEYGYNLQHLPMKVMTALATYPVEPKDLWGITDYLPLWSGNVV